MIGLGIVLIVAAIAFTLGAVAGAEREARQWRVKLERQWRTTVRTPRLPSRRELIDTHKLVWNRKMSEARCQKCGQLWPCETYRRLSRGA